MTTVPVYCTATGIGRFPCHAAQHDHVHQPTPCPDGHNVLHHAFAPPKTVAVDVLGQRRRLKVPT